MYLTCCLRKYTQTPGLKHVCTPQVLNEFTEQNQTKSSVILASEKNLRICMLCSKLPTTHEY